MVMATQMYSDADKLGPALDNNTELVKRIAWRLYRRLPHSVQIEDLIQAGMIGLMEALERYDPEEQASFATFAGIRIRGAMLDEIRRGDWAPRSLHRNARAVKEAREAVERRHGHRASDAAVAAELQISIAEYRRICDDMALSYMASLDATLADQPGLEIADYNSAAPEMTVERQDLASIVERVARELPDREQLLLSLYYKRGWKLRAIAGHFGVSESRACQLHSRAIRRVREKLGEA